MILLLTSIVFLLLYAMLIRYYARGWRSLGEKTNAPQAATFISVIVPARNEENNIPALLSAISEQTYPKELFELIIVDDFSTDNTAKLVREYKKENTRLIQPGKDALPSSKKKTIEAGTNIARDHLIVYTDADCIPGRELLHCINDHY